MRSMMKLLGASALGMAMTLTAMSAEAKDALTLQLKWVTQAQFAINRNGLPAWVGSPPAGRPLQAERPRLTYDAALPAGRADTDHA